MSHAQTRLAVAACASPVVACIVAASVLGVWFVSATDEFARQPALVPTLGYAFYVGVAGGLVLGWPTMFLAGLPTHAWLLRQGRASWLSYAIAGALIGLAPATLVEMLAVGTRATPQNWAFILGVGAATGLVSALLFWLIRRPDRDSASNPPTSSP